MKMTKNEYKKFLEANASRLYNDSSYSMQDYTRDADNVEIIPVDLSEFPQISPKTKELINILFDEEDHDRKNNYMLRGFTHHPDAEKAKLNLIYGVYADCYSFYAYNDTEMIIYTYCEGDTTLTLFNDPVKYEAEKADCEKWWREEKA